MLIDSDQTFGIQECELNLVDLYPTPDERMDFRARFDEFWNSDTANQSIFSLQGNLLKYRSEVFISEKIDHRPPLLLLLGNPASHSVAAGICFAFEKSGQEHRFWRLLDNAGIITFFEQPSLSADPIETIEMKRNALLELKYQSPFRVGIAVFYSIPSAASYKWSGVNGLRRLLGSNAFDLVTVEEEKRIDKIIKKFIGPTGGIITFQKDAYERVRSPDTPEYHQELAKRGLLKGKYKNNQNIFLAGAPSTRLANSAICRSALLHYKNWLFQQFSTK